MSDIEIGVLKRLAKAAFVLITAVCIVQFATRARRCGWHVPVPVLV